MDGMQTSGSTGTFGGVQGGYVVRGSPQSSPALSTPHSTNPSSPPAPLPSSQTFGHPPPLPSTLPNRAFLNPRLPAAVESARQRERQARSGTPHSAHSAEGAQPRYSFADSMRSGGTTPSRTGWGDPLRVAQVEEGRPSWDSAGAGRGIGRGLGGRGSEERERERDEGGLGRAISGSKDAERTSFDQPRLSLDPPRTWPNHARNDTVESGYTNLFTPLTSMDTPEPIQGPSSSVTDEDPDPTSPSHHSHHPQDVILSPSLPSSTPPPPQSASSHNHTQSQQQHQNHNRQKSNYSPVSPKAFIVRSRSAAGNGFRSVGSVDEDVELGDVRRDGGGVGEEVYEKEQERKRRETMVSPIRIRHYPSSSPAIPLEKSRNYKSLNALPMQSTHYFFSGRLQTGGDSPLPLIGSVILVCGMAGLWLGTTGIWIWRDGLGGGSSASIGGKAAVIVFAYLTGIVLSSMFATAFRDPGIIPRGLDPRPEIDHIASDGSEVPRNRELRVRGGKVTVKYCETCRIYRAPRSSHCRLCGNCVENIDHHCSYLHTCIGRRNYTSFATFLISAVLAVIYTVVFSALHFSILCSREGISFRQALQDSPGSAVSFGMGVVVIGPLGALLGYHVRLMFLQSSTIEQIRASASRSLVPSQPPPSNPFAFTSFLRNFSYSLCRPQSDSWVDARGWEVVDGRKVNPGVME